jgi:hypothetical protein
LDAIRMRLRGRFKELGVEEDRDEEESARVKHER